MTTDIAVLDHLVVVNLDIHIWTARKKLVPLDLGGAELPPETWPRSAASASAIPTTCAVSALSKLAL